MATPFALSSAQTEALYRYITDGYTDSQIVRMIEALSRSGERDADDNPWPTVSRQTIAYHRKKFDADGYDDVGGELVKGTIISTRDAILRRYARQMGEIELLMDAIAREMHALEQAGALLGVELHYDEGQGVIIGSIIAIDGEPVPNQIAVRDVAATPLSRDDILHPDVDPLFQRYVQLGHLHVKQAQTWQRIVQDTARVAGLGFPPNLANPVNNPAIPSTARASLMKILEDV